MCYKKVSLSEQMGVVIPSFVNFHRNATFVPSAIIIFDN
jgi:hypothetical protein